METVRIYTIKSTSCWDYDSLLLPLLSAEPWHKRYEKRRNKKLKGWQK